MKRVLLLVMLAACASAQVVEVDSAAGLVRAASRGGAVRLTADITIAQTVKSRVPIDIDGGGFTLTAPATINGIQLEGDGQDMTLRHVRNLKVRGGKIGVATYNVRALIEDLDIRGAQSHGLFAGGSNGGSSCVVLRCKFIGNGQGGTGCGARFGERERQWVWSVYVADCVAMNNGTEDDGETGTGFNVNSPQAEWAAGRTLTRKVVFERCRAEGNRSSGFSTQYPDECCFIDCVSSGNGTGRRGEKHALRLYTGKGLEIRRGVFLGAEGGYGIKLETRTFATAFDGPIANSVFVNDGAELVGEVKRP